MDKESGGGIFAGLLVGAIIGAAVALLCAPQPGSETRRMVKEKASIIKEKASRAIGKLKQTADSTSA